MATKAEQTMPSSYVLPEYCAVFAQYSLFANDDKSLAKRRRVGRTTHWVIRPRKWLTPCHPAVAG